LRIFSVKSGFTAQANGQTDRWTGCNT